MSLATSLYLYQELIDFNFTIRLEDELNVVSLLNSLDITDRNGNHKSLFKDFRERDIEDLFRQYDPNNLDKVWNGLYKNRVILKNNLDKMGFEESIYNELLDTVSINVLDFGIMKRKESSIEFRNFVIHLSHEKILEYLFSKGTDRLLFFFKLTTGQLSRKFTNFLDSLTTDNRALFLGLMIVKIQVFSDGNHRTANHYIEKNSLDGGVMRDDFWEISESFNRETGDISLILEDSNLLDSFADRCIDIFNRIISNNESSNENPNIN